MSDDLRSKFNDPKVLLGQQSGSDMELSSLAPTANKLSSGGGDSDKSEAKKLSDFLEILAQIKPYIAGLEKDIEDIEKDFAKRDGDAWREDLALKILDPDEVPQQEENESIEDYRKRLEPLLINKMLNPDGSIKAQYKNHPEFGDYAEWAQKKNHLNIARGYVQELEDPNTPPERREEIFDWFKQNGNIEELTLAGFEAEKQSIAQNLAKNSTDGLRDNLANTQLSTGADIKFTS